MTSGYYGGGHGGLKKARNRKWLRLRRPGKRLVPLALAGPSCTG